MSTRGGLSSEHSRRWLRLSPFPTKLKISDRKLKTELEEENGETDGILTRISKNGFTREKGQLWADENGLLLFVSTHVGPTESPFLN